MGITSGHRRLSGEILTGTRIWKDEVRKHFEEFFRERGILLYLPFQVMVRSEKSLFRYLILSLFLLMTLLLSPKGFWGTSENPGYRTSNLATKSGVFHSCP